LARDGEARSELCGVSGVAIARERHQAAMTELSRNGRRLSDGDPELLPEFLDA
jgi:hypothetical protein